MRTEFSVNAPDPGAFIAEAEKMLCVPDALTFDYWGRENHERIKGLPHDLQVRVIERIIKDDIYDIGKSRIINSTPTKVNGERYEPQQCRPIDWNALAGLEPPKREWADPLWLGMNHTSTLIGPGGAGKSTLQQQWGSGLSLGRSLFNEEIPERVVMAWNCEDDEDEVWRKQDVIARHFGVGLDAFAGRLFMHCRVGLDNVLFAAQFGHAIFTPLLKELRDQAGDYKAKVVMLDNTAQLFGGNENDRHQVTTFLNGIQGALPGCAVLLASHPSRQVGSEYSGSSAWENATRMRLYLGSKLPDQPPEDDSADAVRYLCKRKTNYSARDWRRFEFRDGVLIPNEPEVGGGLVDGIRKQKAARVLMDAARRLRDMGVRFTDGSTSPQFLPRQVLEYKLAEGCSKRELADAMRDAMLDGKLTRGVVGRYQNRLPMHGLVVEG